MVSSKVLFLSVASLFLDLAVSQQCQGQSCDIADVSGSTGRPYNSAKANALKGGNGDAGKRCIENSYYQLGIAVPPGYTPIVPPPAGYKPTFFWPGQAGATKRDANLETKRTSRIEIEKRQGACKPYTLLWARGTMEPGGTNYMGMSISPGIQTALNQAMPNQWNYVGVNYPADNDGNMCVGLTGGVKCVQQIGTLNKACPNTKFIVGGFSQGGMVAHNCVAFAPEAAKKNVVGVVTFGDPFNGAPIRGFPNDKVKIFCRQDDGVCGGELSITLGHISYALDSSAQDGAKWILQIIKT